MDPAQSNSGSVAVPSGSSLLIPATCTLKVRALLTGAATSDLKSVDFKITGQVVCGTTHTLVLRTDGTVWSFEQNDAGQLRLGSTSASASASPVPVPGLGNVIAVAAGNKHSLALKSVGTVWSWGQNSFGQLGLGAAGTKTAPTQITALSGIAAIAAGLNQSLAVKSDGRVYSFGANNRGQLGVANTGQTWAMAIRRF